MEPIIEVMKALRQLAGWITQHGYRWHRLPAGWLWWLWWLTILIHLFLLVSGVAVLPATPPEGPSIGAGWPLAPTWQAGVVILALILQPGERPPFPWRHWRIRWRMRRRRLADLSQAELLALLPPGGRTIAQLVDRLTRSQMAKLLAAIPILYPILAELDVEAVIDKYCPTQAEVNIGTVIVILCLNRLTVPQPLSGIADWAAKTVIEELTGVPARKLNDDRLARALDAIYPHLEAIWSEVVSRALVRYRIDLSLVFYDLTTFHFEGAYRDNAAITFGFSRIAGWQRGRCEHRPDQHATLAEGVAGTGLAGQCPVAGG